jgi:hypothetical protein
MRVPKYARRACSASWRVQANDERTAENRYDRHGVKERLASCVGVSTWLSRAGIKGRNGGP